MVTIRKLILATLLAAVMLAAVYAVAQAAIYTFCQRVYHEGDAIANVCTAWNIVTSGDQVKAKTNGTRTIQWLKSGYTAVLGPQSCVPLQVWTDEVVCKSTTKFKQNGWPIGGIKMTCRFDAEHMTCSASKVLP